MIRDIPWILSYWRDRIGRERSASSPASRKFTSNDAKSVPTYYINLESRVDRDEQVRGEFDRLGLAHAVRWPGTSHAIGIVGCALSHGSLLRDCHERQLDIVMICEDDLEFLADPGVIEELIAEFMNNDALDVLCIANNSTVRPYPISRSLSITKTTQTCACYVVKNRALAALSANAFESSDRILDGGSIPIFALDILWKSLQAGELRFAVPTLRIARQRKSFSDILGIEVDYGV